MAGEMSNWRAAADRLPSWAARANTRMLVMRSMLFQTNG
jgi:hypothetical protein